MNSHHRPARAILAAALTLSLGSLLAACGGQSHATDSAGSGKIAVVASTNVWGDIAEQVGGNRVEITSIIADPDQDPHSYEASASTQLAISKAALVIENGGGYDDFVDQMLHAHNGDARLINAVDVSGKSASGGEELNEHVWYDLPTVERVADRIAAELGDLEPGAATTFEDNAAAFKAKVARLIAEERRLRAQHHGEGIAITEPVPLYLTGAAGLVNKTPSAFSEAIEEGGDVSPATLKTTLDLFADHQVQALVYNEQTSGPITEQVEKAARDAGIAVVPVTETLPKGVDYLTWFAKNIANLSAALG